MPVKQGSQLFSPAAIGKYFGADMLVFDKCVRQLVSEIHSPGASCPNCSAAIADQQADRFCTFEQIRCRSCGTKFTAATGTGLNGSKLSPREIYLLAVLTWLEVSPPKIAAVIRCHVDTVQNWQLKFRAYQELAGV